MAPITDVQAKTITAIQNYLSKNPKNVPLCNLGMTTNGRIVRLADHDHDEVKILNETLIQNLEALAPSRRKPGDKQKWRKCKTLENYLTVEFKTLENYLTVEFKTPDDDYVTAKFTTLEGCHAKINRDKQIMERLKHLKSKYSEQFKNMHALTSTYEWWGQMRTLGESEEKDPSKPSFWEYCFRNEFTQDRWIFSRNEKMGNIDEKAFYMSNVVAHQFEQAFKEYGWPLKLPKTIERSSIINKKTNETLISHKADYHSDAFKKAFLETTVNGKSTVRVAQDLGMKVNKLTVIYSKKAVDKIDEPITYSCYSAPFSVIAHVSPDPDIYGESE